MFKKKAEEPVVEQKAEKPTPAYLRDDYPYKAVGEALKPEDCQEGVIYEIWCGQCQMGIRSQGQNIRAQYERLMSGNGCIGCGNKELAIRRVDMSASTR